MYSIKSDERGRLGFIEFQDLPFVPKRLFIVSDVPVGSTRGYHAHENTDQFLICISGKILVETISKNQTTENILDVGYSLFLPRMTWSTQKYIEKNSQLLVLCSTSFTEDIYIRNFNLL